MTTEAAIIEPRDLPDDEDRRRRIIEARSRPNPKRPRLPEEYERILEKIDARDRECYADAEELTYQIRRAARDLGT